MLNTESDIQLDADADCPLRSVEELRKCMKLLCNRGHNASLSTETAADGAAGIPSRLFSQFQEWMWPFAELTRAYSFSLIHGILKADTGVGSWAHATLKYDARWHTPGYASTHGSGNCTAYRMPLPIPPLTGNQVDDDATKARIADQNIRRGGMIPVFTTHKSQNAKDWEVELGVLKHEASAGQVDPDGAEAAIREAKGLGMEIEAWIQDGDGKTEARAADVAKELGFKLNVAGCVNHIVKTAINAIIKQATKDPTSKSDCRIECAWRLKKDGTIGQRKACRRVSVRFARVVISKAVMTWLKKQPTPQSQADISAIQSRFETELEPVILGHAFGNCNETCQHTADWDPTKPGSIISCVGQQGLIVRILLSKVGGQIPKMYIPGHGLYVSFFNYILFAK
jgi:hypothetical protein